MIKITNLPTLIHTINQRIEVVNFLLYHPGEGAMPGYVELVARSLDGRELVQSYDRLYSLVSGRAWAIQYELPIGIPNASINARLRIPYQPAHTREVWLQPSVVSSENTTTTDRLLALATAVDGLTATLDNIEQNTMRRSESTTEQRVDVGASNVQLVAGDAGGQRLSVVVAHAGESGMLYVRTGPDPATATAWNAAINPGDLIELETGEAVQALASDGTIPVNVTEVF